MTYQSGHFAPARFISASIPSIRLSAVCLRWRDIALTLRKEPVDPSDEQVLPCLGNTLQWHIHKRGLRKFANEFHASPNLTHAQSR
jgi:hypothetical protein